jgi:hypothetical protein
MANKFQRFGMRWMDADGAWTYSGNSYPEDVARAYRCVGPLVKQSASVIQFALCEFEYHAKTQQMRDDAKRAFSDPANIKGIIFPQAGT